MPFDITTARVEERERATAGDFEYGFQSLLSNMAAVDRLFLSAGGDYVIGGGVTAAGGFAVNVAPFWAGGGGGLPAYRAEGAGPLELEPPGPQGRVDIIQARGAMQAFDSQPREFYDSEMDRVRTLNIHVKNRLRAEVGVKKGGFGAGEAPRADPGWVKLAEVKVEAGAALITQADITCAFDGGAWTADAGSVFAARDLAHVWALFAEHKAWLEQARKEHHRLMPSAPEGARPFVGRGREWEPLIIPAGGEGLLADYSEKTTDGVPRVLAGSNFDVGGIPYTVKRDELPEGFADIKEGWAYVYARRLGEDAARFWFDNTPPAFNAAGGGWAHPDAELAGRCLMSVWKAGGGRCLGKALMGRTSNLPPRPDYKPGAGGNDAGALVLGTNDWGDIAAGHIEAGWYLVRIRGGRGGNGGAGGQCGAWTGTNGGGSPLNRLLPLPAVAGQPGQEGERLELILYLERGPAELSAGRSGMNGKNGEKGIDGDHDIKVTPVLLYGSGDGGAGGDGHDGEPSLLTSCGKIAARASGGRGGRGRQGAAGSVGTSSPAPILQNVSPYQGAPYQVGVLIYPPNTWVWQKAAGRDGAAGEGYADAVTGHVELIIL